MHVSRPDALIGLPDLEKVEHLVRRAIDEHRDDLLDVVGYGEFSLALRWPVDAADIVVKRVPPFASPDHAAEYRRITRAYIDTIEAAGVACVTTELLQLDRPDGKSVVFHCQPLLDRGQLVSNVLRASAPDPGHPVVTAVVNAVAKVVGPGVAFDGQCSNWGWVDDRVWHLDFSTPFLLGDDFNVQFEQSGFELEYPAFVRGLADREARKWLPKYTELDFVLADVVALLHREHLEAWCPAFAQVIRDELGITIDLAQAEKNYKSDARLYPFMHRLRKLQRFWLQHTGRKYESLLTDKSSYGN
jgi:hypothetical protein